MVLPKMMSDEDSRAYQAADEADVLSKVPQVTFAFWIVKILATTLGETGGDALSMTLKLGYAESTLIFLAFFVCTLFAQVKSRHYHPVFYWGVVVATTTVGTTTSDYFDRTLGLGYVKSSIILLCLVIAVLVGWRHATGAIRVDRITARKDEVFYWVTILVSNTLGTALGDFVATTTGLGLRARFAGLRRADRPRGRCPLHHESPEYPAFLGCLRPDAAPRGDARRYAYKAARRGRAGARPDRLVACDRGGNGRPHCRHVAPEACFDPSSLCS